MIATKVGDLKTRVRSVDDAIGIFLTPDGRLPGFAQRRLDDLIARKRTVGLTRKEQRELSETLEYIDAKTIQMLEHALSPPAGIRGQPKTARARQGSPAVGKTRTRQNGRR